MKFLAFIVFFIVITLITRHMVDRDLLTAVFDGMVLVGCFSIVFEVPGELEKRSDYVIKLLLLSVGFFALQSLSIV